MTDKLYWHELTEDDIERLYDQRTTWGQVQYMFHQPNWCSYLNALEGEMGCWSLIYKDTRSNISKQFCESCDCYIN